MGVVCKIGANGVVTWDLGTIPTRTDAGDNWGVFHLTVDVSNTVPTGTESLSENCVGISTTSPGDFDPDRDQRSFCSGRVDVWEDDAGINVDKWVDPGDPTPGQEYEYNIHWCSDTGTNFGPAWLTDTRPVSSTLIDWWTDWPRNA